MVIISYLMICVNDLLSGWGKTPGKRLLRARREVERSGFRNLFMYLKCY
jgi:hypothetical protein